MASFTIQELLGLGKDNSANSSSKSEDSISELAAAKNSKDGANNKPRVAPPPASEGEDIDHDIDVETLGEDSNAELVSRVEVRRIVYTTSPASVSRASRKRKRSKQAEESPAKSDEDHPEGTLRSSSSPGCSSNNSDSNSEERNTRTPKPTTKRLRTAFTTAQLRALEYSFRMCPYPDSYGREQIARLTGIDESKIQVWFQNRRARYRKREKPMESQKSSSAAQSSTASPFSHHSMMQAYFTAAALQPGAKLPITPTTPLGPLPQQFYTPSNPFIATAVPATAYPPLFTYPASPMDLMAAAAHAQIHAARQTQKNHSPK